MDFLNYNYGKLILWFLIAFAITAIIFTVVLPLSISTTICFAFAAALLRSSFFIFSGIRLFYRTNALLIKKEGIQELFDDKRFYITMVNEKNLLKCSRFAISGIICSFPAVGYIKFDDARQSQFTIVFQFGEDIDSKKEVSIKTDFMGNPKEDIIAKVRAFAQQLSLNGAFA